MKNPISTLSNLQQRIIAGILGATLLVGGILASGYSFAILIFALSMLCLNEFYTLLENAGKEVMRKEGLFIASVLLISLLVINTRITLVLVAPALLVAPLIIALFKNYQSPFTAVGHTILGLIYIILPFLLLLAITLDLQIGYYEPTLMIATLFLVWCSDTGGYFAGISIGKHKLFERISPKKTWEGAAGSLLAAVLLAFFVLPKLYGWLSAAGVITGQFYGDCADQVCGWNALTWCGLAVVVVVFGILGDLVESMLKRSLGVKDSGNVIPGHGGFLDRFDAFVFVIPFVWIYALLHIMF